MTRLPLTFGPLVELAEAQVRADWPIEEQTRARLGHSVRGDTLDDYCDEVRAFVIGCAVDRLSDLTRPESQAAWLRWLAGGLGVPVPDAGTPRWERIGPNEWRLGDPDVGCEFFLFGAFVGAPVHECPALPNPDSPDAPIRALVLAILTVGAT